MSDLNAAQRTLYTEMCARLRTGLRLSSSDTSALREAEQDCYLAVAQGGTDVDEIWRVACLSGCDNVIVRMNAE
jgi:hypothetical protein